MILRKLRSLANAAHFVTLNLKAFAKLPEFPVRGLPNGGIVRGCKRNDLQQVVALKMQLEGSVMSMGMKILLTFIPGKCCIVSCDRQGRLSALSIFYFNERDLTDGTIHEGFIGVRDDYAGQSIGSNIREFAKNHFAQSRSVHGISSRITLSNAASIASGLKVGYECLETYEDSATGELRGYFINRLNCPTK